MEILGNTNQEKEPLPTEPVEIKNSLIIVTKDGKRIEIPSKLKPIEKFYKKNGKWYVRWKE